MCSTKNHFVFVRIK